MIRLAWRRSASRDSLAPLFPAAFLRADGALQNSRGRGNCFRPILHPPSERSPLLRRPQPACCLSMASGGMSPLPPPKHTNRLAQERSPYLLQHAHNPVDWYPWGQDAFDKAKNEDKPIFLSVGYSTCHWCHVMERESFEDEDIGKILSDNFVCIKVDREERPDVDKVYMTFVQATSGSGGWPMSVWLTPDLRPFIGGTYFPPTDHARRPGLKTVLNRIIEQWQNNRPALESNGEKILEALKKGTAVAANPGDDPPPAPAVASRCFQQLAHSYEEEYGGFRDAPKFPTPGRDSVRVGLLVPMDRSSYDSLFSPPPPPPPPPPTVNLMFLMSYWSVHRSTSEGVEALQMALHTLRMMALGGIHDHVAQVSGEQMFADVAKDILLYVSRDLSDKSGGFYSAEDADSVPASGGPEKREGAFCVWTASEVREHLPDAVEGAARAATRADVFMHHYGVKEQGNVALEQDPHGELQGQNVLIVRYSVELTAARFGISVERAAELLASARTHMAKVRRSRPRPHLDTKMLASWSGLMLSAYARVGAVLGDQALLQRAVQAGDFLQEHLWDAERQTMLRSCYRGDEMEVQQISTPISGFLDDYAFVICGALDLYEATLRPRWLQWAEELQRRQDALFWDEQGGGYFCSDPGDRAVLLRLKEDQDGAEPSANSVSASNLLRLSHYCGRGAWLQRARQLLAAFSDRLTKVPIALPEMVQALVSEHHTLQQVLMHIDADANADADGFLRRRLPALSSMTQRGGVATAYVCRDSACSLPVTDPQELRRLLLDGAAETRAD
ncbi:Spermatogenesis-associated protein 20 [Liparis tanakae]|uniref:Spermatogenesis-associated protein 20 n=1 Tax=Liparis tanakae TaxID=230148 RepID=A0A4Z2H3F1_9TELE|nr:Spermatogenesis-associated protein 20 [Liparis tanakae]